MLTSAESLPHVHLEGSSLRGLTFGSTLSSKAHWCHFSKRRCVAHFGLWRNRKQVSCHEAYFFFK